MWIDGIRVVNPTKKLQISISQRDCDRGQTKDPGACAAARALLREVPNAKQARVHLGRTYVLIDDGGKKVWERYQTPQSLRAEIIAFDRGGEFAPGEYTIPPLPPSVRAKFGKRQGTPHATDNIGSKKRKRIARPIHVTENVRAKGANR
jgi:hypothetical protein